MKFLEKLGLDEWYNLVIYLGAAALFLSFFIKVDFLQNKHLFGFGLGWILLGLAFKVSAGFQQSIIPPSYQTGGNPMIMEGKGYKLNVGSILLLILGVG